MRRPERCPCTCTRAADVAAQSQGDPVRGISSAAGEDPTQTSSSSGERMGDGHGKSSLLWIVIIALLTAPASTLSQMCVCVFMCESVCGIKNNLFISKNI